MASMGAPSGVGGCAGKRPVLKTKRSGGNVRCAATKNLKEQYRTLKIQPGASEQEVKKAFRRLALQYHPDVCKGGKSSGEFHQINEAYHMVMNSFRRSKEQDRRDDVGAEELTTEMYDPNWDLWEEWMGWEGASTTGDYSSHINPYI
ncbi:DnaJ domain [Musa troglodytarum]|uniref:DnaJ domain n=1 Tax=Musa troglodytarum TaxID=320322 RepID=A0A9E7JNS7_9LILI|nr:DnaJ domain [Musa troglodytarum]